MLIKKFGETTAFDFTNLEIKGYVGSKSEVEQSVLHAFWQGEEIDQSRFLHKDAIQNLEDIKKE